jgi:pyridoxamine 5'-phosphate oxidase family protein
MTNARNPAGGTISAITFTDNEKQYLESQLARIATADGGEAQPNVAPVGFDFDGPYFYVSGHDVERTLKYRNVQSNPRVSLVVDDQPSVNPWVVRGVKIHGMAEIIARDGYVGAGAYIQIEPKRKWSWGIDSP